MVHEMPVQYLTVHADTWQCKQFCWSKIWRSRKCLDIRFAMDYSDSNLRSGVQLIQYANWSDQRQTHPNKYHFNSVCYSTFVFNFTELVTHPALVNIKSFSIAEHIFPLHYPKKTLTQNCFKTVPRNLFNRTALIPNNFFTFDSEPNFESQFCRPLL